MATSGWKEDAIHRWLLAQAPARGLAGSRGSDAAVLAGLRGRPVLCADQTVEGVHYDRGVEPRTIGRKAVARSLSDLAATAATPRAILVTLAAPADRTSKWMQAVLAGARSMAREGGADLVGGDLSTTRGPATVSVAALGEIAGTKRPPGRDRARPGQFVVLTGPVGGSLLGRHLAIRPRIREGARLYAAGATGLMDGSDGLAWDLFKLARASDVRIDLDLAAIPIHADALAIAEGTRFDPLWHALHDGEDHELVATLPPRAQPRLPRLWIVGRVVRGTGLHLVDAGGRARAWKKSAGAFEHGSAREHAR